MHSLVRIEGTSFTMGSETGADNERPLHRVWVDSFELGAMQVSNTDYAAFLRATALPPPPFWEDPRFNDPLQPVVAISWFDAVSYCQWRSVVASREIRLPTEAEWELAARGGTEGALYPWGNDPPESRPRYDTRWRHGPEPCGTSNPNGYGLYDLCENVHEWCSDWYDAGYYGVSGDRNPHGPESGTRRVSRGGSWRHQIKLTRCAARSSIPPEFRYLDYGFRIAADAIHDLT